MLLCVDYRKLNIITVKKKIHYLELMTYLTIYVGLAKMYANLDGDITCSNVFEDFANLLSNNTFPMNYPLFAMHILALNGLIAIIRGMAAKVGNGSFGSKSFQ